MEKSGKCIKQSALNVEKNVRFPSSLIQVDPFIAKNVIAVKDQQDEDFKLAS